jgi:hypothetical protein
MELVKLPVPVPSLVLLSAVVGLGLVLQQTPRAVTVAPPSSVTFPPESAVVEVMLEIAVVVMVGTVSVVNSCWSPYAVPTEFVA